MPLHGPFMVLSCGMGWGQVFSPLQPSVCEVIGMVVSAFAERRDPAGVGIALGCVAFAFLDVKSFADVLDGVPKPPQKGGSWPDGCCALQPSLSPTVNDTFVVDPDGERWEGLPQDV